MYEGHREIPNYPIAYPPSDLDVDPDTWTCPLCGVEGKRPFGHPPSTCWNCGQNPQRDEDPNDWGEKEQAWRT